MSPLRWLAQDVRDGLRPLRRRPGFALFAAGTLALGLATSTAVFTYLNAYQRPFPGADAGDLFQVFQVSEDTPFGVVSYPDFLDLDSSGESGFATAGLGLPLFGATVRHETLTEVIFGQGVTGDYFATLRVGMAAGRGLSPDDDRPEAPPAVVLSHAYWGLRYDSDGDVLGRTILLNNEPYTIIGVAGPEFLGSTAAYRPQVWLPFSQFKRVYWARSDREADRERGSVSPYLRLSEGTSVAQATAALAALASALDRDVPLADRERRFVLAPATWISPTTRANEASTSRIMMLAAAGLLLLACANVANLVLSAGARRDHEMALRGAMGATRGRLLRQLTMESLLLSGLAGAMALAAAGPAAARLSAYFARPSVWGANVPREIVVDPRVMAFAIAAAVLTGVVTGLLPGLRASSGSPGATLTATGPRASEPRARGRLRLFGTRDVLVSVQVALSVVLIVLAGLVLRTLDSARRVDPGFDAGTTLASYISTSSMGVPVDERHRFFEDLMRRFEEMPWVRAATVAERAVLTSHPVADLRTAAEGDLVRATVARVYPGFFETMGMEMLLGRSLEPADTVDALGVVVVNEALARRMEVDGDVVGTALWWPGDEDQPDRRFDVVGVVRNARLTSFLDDPEPVAYFSLPQHYSAPGNAFMLRVAGEPAVSVERMQRELRAVDSRLAIVNILPYSEVVRGSLYTQRMNAELFTVIAALGLMLAAAGVFGVVALAVTHRRREIGVRMALGAARGAVVRLVVGMVAAPLVVGVLVGLGLAWLATRLIGSLLLGVTPGDPVTLGVGAVVLFVALVLAVVAPVLRALNVDPVASLRVE